MTSPLSRAEQVREALRKTVEWDEYGKQQASGEALALIPEGALILTAAEAEQVRESLAWLIQHGGRATTHCKYLPIEALALLSAGQPGQDEK